MIQISAQYGGPETAHIFPPLQRELNSLFEKHTAENYFLSLIALSIVFRVSGTITNFNWDGPELFKYSKRTKELTIDLTIPQAKWEGKTEHELRCIIKEGITACFEIFESKAKELGEIKDEVLLRKDFNEVMNCFLG